jgi:hypothetical protein
MLNNKWFPDRKWLAGGVAGVITWAITTFVVPEMNPELITGAVAGVMGVVYYFVPASISDVIKRGDVFLKNMNTADPVVEAPVDPVV